VAAIVAGVVIFGGGGGEKPKDTTTAIAPVAPPVDPRIETARRELDRALAFEKENPTAYVELILYFDSIAEQFKGLPAGQEAETKRQAALDAWRTAVQGARQKLETDVAAHIEGYRYAEALALLAAPDAVLADSDDQFGGDNRLDDWIDRQKKDLTLLSTAKARLEDLERKAAKYPEHVEIAMAILEEGFPEAYESEAEAVWLKRDETIAAIRKNGLKGWLERERGAEVARAEATRLATEEEERRRKERWDSLLGSLEWMPHIGRHNLYNWVATSDTLRVFQGQEPTWKLKVIDGEPTLVAENATGTDGFIGPFTNHWKDYVLEFEMRLLAGKLSVSPRTTLAEGEFIRGIADQTSPMFSFSEENGVGINKWVRVEILVNGDHIQAKIDGREKPLLLEKETARIPEAGGFLFSVADGARVEVRKVRTKLVNSSRDSLF